jgi:hypothetical protein
VDVHTFGAEDELLQPGFLSIFWRDHDLSGLSIILARL